MNATTITDIKLRINQIIDKQMNEMELFKQLYRWTFRFGLEYGHRILSLDMAIILWRLVYTIHKPDILDRWLSFLENDSNIRGIPKDTWNMFQNFSESFDLASYNSDDAWPSLFDDFVLEYRNEIAAKLSAAGAGIEGAVGQEATNNNIDLNNFNYSTVNNQVFKL